MDKIVEPAPRDELDIGRAIAAGELTSPQQYENLSIFAVRITGTGGAYRDKLDEYVWRDPALYLNQEFCDRCAGLFVVWEHPDDSVLNAKELSDRVVGSITFAYIKGDEVWGIAKIVDENAAKLMTEKQLSTSPGVKLGTEDSNRKLTFEDGTVLLVEGSPVLLDHLAICEQGVWDKGRDPVGVETTAAPTGEEDDMPEEENKVVDRKDDDDKARKDSVDLTTLLSRLDAMCGILDSVKTRMDSLEVKEKGDPEEVVADKKSRKDDDDDDDDRKDAKSRKDDDEDRKEVVADKKSRKDDDDDKTRKDSASLTSIKAELDALRAAMPKPRTDVDDEKLAKIQVRADEAYSAHGLKAGRALDGETPLAYQRRLLKGLRQHSKTWAGMDLSQFPEVALEPVSQQIYADSIIASRNPVNMPAGRLQEFHSKDLGGRDITEFRGDWSAAFGAFESPARIVGRINTGNSH